MKQNNTPDFLLKQSTFSKLFLSLLFLIGVSSVSFAQTFTDNASGTWVVPTGVTSISVQAWGAGGAGGGSTTNGSGGSGGGGGAYAINTFAVTPGQNINYTVGTAGAGSNGAGTAGNDTTILALTARGGTGGGANQGAIGTGGTATGGSTNTTGGNGLVGTAIGGNGGNGANGGAGGAGVNGGPGLPGNTPGGGGGAERQGGGSAGGNGAVGQITITWTPFVCNTPASIDPVTTITATTATLNWTSATPAPSNGYQWEVRTSGAGGSGATGLAANGATGAGVTTANVTGLTASTNYSVYVRSNCGTGFSSWAGPVTFTTSASSPPPNDECLPGGPIGLTVNPDQSCTTTTSGTLFQATNSGVTTSGCGRLGNNDVWYRFVATSTTHTVDLLNIAGSTTDLYHAIYAFNPCSNPDPDTAITCSDFESSTTGGLTIGATYFVQVYSWSSSPQTSTFDICIGVPPGPPANDSCATPTALTVNPDYSCASTSPGTVLNATNSGIDVCGGTEDDDVWYRFQATSTAHRISIINISGSTTDMYHAVYDAGPCGSLATAIICNDNNESNITGLTIGNFYFVQVYTWTAFTGQNSTFDVCVGTPPACTTPNAPTALTFNTIEDDFIDASFTGSGATNYLILMNTTGTTPTTPTNGVVYNVSDTSLGALVIDNDNNTNFTATGLTQTTQYFFFIYAFNNTGCSGGPTYSATTLNGDATTVVPSYCTPSSTSTSDYIDDFTTSGGSTNINHMNSGFSANGYGNFTGMNVTQFPGSPINFSANHVGGTFATRIWVDWNNDLDFIDANELVFSGGYANPQTGSFNVLGSAAAGSYRMRVRSDWSNTTLSPCGFDDRSETHDYTLIVTPLNCTDDPIAVTAVSTTSTTATISWTHPVPQPALGYEYIISTDDSTSTPAGDITGTTAGNSLSLTGLLAGTTYYVFVRGVCNAVDNGLWVTTSFNTGCADLVTMPTVCPTIAGVQGTDPFTADPFVADPTAQIDCNVRDVTLEAYSNLRETTSYIAEKIVYNKVPADFAPSGFSVPQNIVNDDVWAPSRTNITFPFCYFGETFTQCLSNANGSLTFDQSIIPGSASGWSITSDLPSTASSLVEKTIFGVYQDLDPRFLGGNPISSTVVGTAPCREFRMAWHDIPLYSDSSRLQTAMIVLHETTNIIEIFIENKTIENGNVNPWNGGNAIVGIQGDITPLAPNNQYSVAACRNGLDTNWETTNEAWRFTPNGAVITPDAITWYQGSVAPGNVLVDNGDGTVTVNTPDTYIAVSDYTLCSGTVSLTDDIVLIDTKKTWTGAINTDWYEDGNWAPANHPTPSDCVLIPDPSSSNNRSPIADILNVPIPTPPAGFGAYALNLTVATGGYLDVRSNTNLVVTDWIDLDGTIDIRDSASLIQIIDSGVDVNTNSGTGTMNMQRTVPTGVDASDYVYWSSPTDEDFNVTDISAVTGELIFEWNPTIFVNSTIQYGNWIPASGIMSQGKGYIIRGLLPTVPLPANTTEFSGIPQNGIVRTPITRGTYNGSNYNDGTPGSPRIVTSSDDNWNLIGNPYPSAIDYTEFIKASNNPHIDGTIYFWTHANTPIRGNGSPFYSDFLYNYGSDYISYNGSGANPPGSSTGNIAAGQGFFVEMLHTTPSQSENITFNNTMRNETLINSDFHRTNESSQPSSGTEKHRIWLDLIDTNELAASILVGYIEGATNSKDRIFDGHAFVGAEKSFYSLIEEERLSIQGRSLPFDENDTVSLGLFIPETGNYTIAINTIDGLFEDTNQAIYLEDTYNGVIHDLRIAPYTFNTELGTFDDRFILRYTNDRLSTEEFEMNTGIQISAPNNNYIKVTSVTEPIKSVAVYDVLGRVLYNNVDVNASEIIINDISNSDGILFVRATLTNGLQKTQKVILK